MAQRHEEPENLFIFGNQRVKTRVAEGAVGAGTAGQLASLRVVLRESPVAWAAFEGPLI